MYVVIPKTITPLVLTSSNVPETDAAAYNAGTTYNVGDTVMLDHRVYESLTDHNTGNSPDTSPLSWLDLGPTNRYKMFDNTISSQTTNPNTIVVELTPGQLVNSVALFNVIAETVNVRMVDPNAHEVYNETINLTDYTGINDWWPYFFYPIVRSAEAVFLNLPAYPMASVIITIDNGSNDAAVGETVIGIQQYIGQLLTDVNLGIVDYSVKSTDDFGNTTIIPRRNSDRVEYPIMLNSADVYQVRKLLKSILAIPTVYIGSLTRLETYVFGYYKDSRVVLSKGKKSACSIEVESLT